MNIAPGDIDQLAATLQHKVYSRPHVPHVTTLFVAPASRRPGWRAESPRESEAGISSEKPV